jgi:serine/threonine protein kinase
MIGNTISEADCEERRNAILLSYLEAVEAGEAPDRNQLLAEHPSLYGELEAFFASHDQLARLAAPLREANREVAISSTQPEAGRSEVPAEIGQLGDFRLLREVGRGGMGVVYEAEQSSLRRRVALKVLPFAAAIDSRQLQRFKNEALAAAHLRHENIVPVHAVGCERGVHYYAMQFIEGQSLAALIGDLRRAGEPQTIPGAETVVVSIGDTAASLSRDRTTGNRRYAHWVATLGRQAALALEHAHQTGIVHRDIKPANLLIDLGGQLWVTDFGLAQVTGDVGLTATGEVLGTLRYASPEQVLARRGVVDHRSDIYSLGATLYELLTLRPIFEGRDRHELLRQIADDEPRPPRSLSASVPAELETIVLKAVSKEPGERYATAQELADDLQRFLDHRPILARRPTLTERLRKWGRRHPAVVVSCAVVLLLWSIGSVVSMALIREEQQRTKAEQQKAELAYEGERQRAEEAAARFQLARRSVDEMIQISEEELTDRPAMEGARKRLLRSALAYYQEFIEEVPDDPEARADLLDTKARVEKILADLVVLRAGSQLHLLGQTVVLDDLHLSDDQRSRIKEWSARVAKQRKDSFAEVSRLLPGERTRRALEQAKANEAYVNAILTPEQQERLREIGLQSEGAAAFRDPEVVTALQLTAGQRERIRAIEEEAFMRWLRTMQPGKPTVSEPKSKPVNERILSVLTEEQALKWKEMTGEPLKGLVTPMNPRTRDPKMPPG